MKAAPFRPTDNELVCAKIARLRRGAVPRVLDLFSGCGGLSLGLKRAGFAIVAGVDSDPQAAASHAINFHEGRRHHAVPRDVTDPKVKPASLCEILGLGPVAEAVDIVIGGPPCQAFARIGRAKLRAIAGDPEAFLKDPRAGLHERWLAWVSEAKNTLRQTLALLKGIIVAETDAAMTPKATKKDKRLDRYYASMDLIRNRPTGDASGPLRLPAGMVEDAVVGEIRRMIRAPDIATRTIKALHTRAPPSMRRPSSRR